MAIEDNGFEIKRFDEILEEMNEDSVCLLLESGDRKVVPIDDLTVISCFKCHGMCYMYYLYVVFGLICASALIRFLFYSLYEFY